MDQIPRCMSCLELNRIEGTLGLGGLDVVKPPRAPFFVPSKEHVLRVSHQIQIVNYNV